jgi:hypothetical protein
LSSAEQRLLNERIIHEVKSVLVRRRYTEEREMADQELADRMGDGLG